MGGRVRLAVTLGDPRGIGPEIAAAASHDARVIAAADLVYVSPSKASDSIVEALGEWRAGGTAAAAGRFAGLSVDRAITMALGADVQGIVTAPLDKHALLAGGFDFPGHTEMLAARTGCDVAMMLAAVRANAGMVNPLRVVLATTHIALRDVPSALTAEIIRKTAEVTRAGLQKAFQIAEPRIALCGMNPHLGDGGRFGNEDLTLLEPAARASGLLGPFSADTVFVRAMKGSYDAVIAPYHDVGMTAIKVASFGAAVNVTLGLPFPRTSPDHGTALDIAGKGIADASSMIEAILLCVRIVDKNSEVGGRLASSI